jgi:uncharacterized membrane protein YcaP (DUF421 family)
MFFESWFSILRILVVGTSAYVALVAFIRLFGKRTLSKMNAFDFVVTVALGSTLATVIMSKDIKLLEGLTALLLLCGLQYVVAFVSVRSRRAERLVKSEPTLLYFKGRFLHGAMRGERVTESEILSAVRAEGIGDLTQVEAAVLEADGSVSIITGPSDKQTTIPRHEAQADASR